jgi:phospholipase/carboxylesterase
MPVLTRTQQNQTIQKTQKIKTSKDASNKPVELLDLQLVFDKQSIQNNTSCSHPHYLFSPMHYEPKYAYPLLVWLHHTGSDEREVLRIMPHISLRNYAAVAPRGTAVAEPIPDLSNDLSVAAILNRPKTHYGWTDCPEGFDEAEQRIFDCIAVAKERCNIADRKIFIAGFGVGGAMALRIALQFPDRFAGAASFGIDGTLPTNTNVLSRWLESRNLSVLLGMGANTSESDDNSSDALCHQSETMELIYTSGMNIDINEYPNIQLLMPEMLQDLNRWMMQIVCR